MTCSAVRCAVNFLQRIVPGDFLELAGAARAGALDGVRDAVGMVEHLQARLAARAELSLVDGMLRDCLRAFSPGPS